jgi:hypothetical protein
MRLQTYLIIAISATVDLGVAYLFIELGFNGIGIFMAGVSVAGYVLALVLWRKSRAAGGG